MADFLALRASKSWLTDRPIVEVSSKPKTPTITYAKVCHFVYDSAGNGWSPDHVCVFDLDTGAEPVDPSGTTYGIVEVNTEEGWFVAYAHPTPYQDDFIRIEGRRLEIRPHEGVEPVYRPN